MLDIKNKEVSKYDKISEILQTISIALLICLRAINEAMTVALSSTHGYLNIILIVSLIFFIAGTVIKKVFNGTVKKIYITKGGASFFAVLVVWYAFSLKNTATSFIEFLSIAVVPSYIVYKSEVHTDKLLLCIGIIATAILPLSSNIFIIRVRNAFLMDVSYAFLPCIISAILHIGLYFNDNNNKLIFIFDIPALYYFILIFQYGMRGTLLSILVAIMLMITLGNKKKSSGRQWVVILTAIIAMFNLEGIFTVAQKAFNARGVSIYFIEKFIRLGGEGDHKGR